MGILFIINPVAGKNKLKDITFLIRNKMKQANIKFDIVRTTQPGEAVNISKEGLLAGYNTIVAVGGDGTINEVAKGLIVNGCGRLGIIPMGTGNDLVKSLNISLDPEEAIDVIIKGHTKSIDVGIVNDKAFLNVASIGLDAEVVQNTEKVKSFLMSKFSYVIGLLITMLSYKHKRILIQLDKLTLEKEALLVAVGNGRYYGGGMKICPVADLEDNYFHICLISKISKLKLLFIFPSIFKGKHLKYTKHVNMYKAKSISIQSKDKMYINIDGEVTNTKDNVNFYMFHKSIDVIC